MKIGIIYNPTQEWMSMQELVPQIVRIYQNKFQAVEKLDLNQKASVDTLVVADGNLDVLIGMLDQSRFSQIIIHVHGDFMDRLAEWMKFLNEYKSLKLKFVCSSESQKKLISNLMAYECNIVAPYNFKSKTIQIPRKESYSFLYFGRISENKNVDWLIKYFEKIQTLLNREDTLYIRGPVDDIKCMIKDMGRIEEDLENYIMRLADASTCNIDCKFGKFSKEEFDGKEFFISLSTYHDEDFGVSVYQAIDLGLVPLLTNWGGYKEFNKALGLKGVMIDFSLSGGVVNISSFVNAYKSIIEPKSYDVSTLFSDEIELVIDSENYIQEKNLTKLSEFEEFKRDIGPQEAFNDKMSQIYYKLYNGSYS